MDDAGSSLRGDFEELYARWFAAIPRHDDSFFHDVLADDWVYTDTSGTVRGKAAYLPYIAGVPSDAPPNELLEIQLRVYGDLVVAHGEYAVASTVAGSRELGSRTRFTAVWIRRDGAWAALAHHGTTVVAPG
jgi:uncharacterized protein (TIGR02246 family)